MIITCNINEETFKINYFGKFILVDYKNNFLKHAEDFYLDLKYDGDKMIDLYIFSDEYIKNKVTEEYFNKVPKWN